MDAAPAYLSCELQTRKGVEALTIVADEIGQMATITYPKYKISARHEALFSPSEVTISYEFGSIVVDRSTLAVVQTTKLPIGKATIERGECKLTPLPADRKF